MARRGYGSSVDGGVVLFGDAVVEVSSFLGVGGAGGGCCVFWEGATGRPCTSVSVSILCELARIKDREMKCIPTSRSKAAGSNDSREPSSFSGVRHFWQYMLAMVNHGSVLFRIMGRRNGKVEWR